MPVCKVCKGEKPTREMRMWGGGATETCQVCHDEKKAGKKSAPPIIVAPTTPKVNGRTTELVMEASLGFAAKVDGDSLVISQANSNRENDDDNVTLTRAEAKRLFDTFGEWIVAA